MSTWKIFTKKNSGRAMDQHPFGWHGDLASKQGVRKEIDAKRKEDEEFYKKFMSTFGGVPHKKSRKAHHRNKRHHPHKNKKKSRKAHKMLYGGKRTPCHSTRKRRRCCKAGAYKKRVGTHTRISKRTVCYTNKKRKRCCKAGKY